MSQQHEARIARLERMTPAARNPVLSWSDEKVETEALKIIRQVTGYTGTLSGPAGVQVARLLLRCDCDPGRLDQVDRDTLTRLLGGQA